MTAEPNPWGNTFDDRDDPYVAGSCPMCGASLLLNDASQIACTAGEGCPDELAVHKLLSDAEREHIVRIKGDRFHVKHPLRERVNDGMLDCTLYVSLCEFRPTNPGQYRVRESDLGLEFEALA